MFDQNEVRNIFDICGSVIISSLGCYDDLVIVLEYNSCIMHLKIVAVEKTNSSSSAYSDSCFILVQVRPHIDIVVQ